MVLLVIREVDVIEVVLVLGLCDVGFIRQSRCDLSDVRLEKFLFHIFRVIVREHLE